MEFTIRAATLDDAPGMLPVLNPIIEDGRLTIMSEPATVESQRAWMSEAGERAIVNVAIGTVDGRILGMQSIEPETEHTEAMRHVGDISTFVALDCRGHGIGRALTEATIAAAPALGYCKVIAVIRADNPDAIAFYENMGFEVKGVLREHVCLRDRFVDEVIAERML